MSTVAHLIWCATPFFGSWKQHTHTVHLMNSIHEIHFTVLLSLRSGNLQIVHRKSWNRCAVCVPVCLCASKGNDEHDLSTHVGSALSLYAAMPSLSSQSNRITIIAPIAAGRIAFCHSHRCWQTCNCNHRQFRLQLTARRARRKSLCKEEGRTVEFTNLKIARNFFALCVAFVRCSLSLAAHKSNQTRSVSYGKCTGGTNFSWGWNMQKLAIASLLIRSSRS